MQSRARATCDTHCLDLYILCISKQIESRDLHSGAHFACKCARSDYDQMEFGECDNTGAIELFARDLK